MNTIKTNSSLQTLRLDEIKLHELKIFSCLKQFLKASSKNLQRLKIASASLLP